MEIVTSYVEEEERLARENVTILLQKMADHNARGWLFKIPSATLAVSYLSQLIGGIPGYQIFVSM